MRKKPLSVVIFLLTLVSLQLTHVASGCRTWTVDDDGPADFRTIQEAVDAASNGDVVLVHSGVHYEDIVISKTLSLIGDSPFDTIVDAGQEASASVILIGADGVAVKGLTLRNSVGSSYFDVGGGIYTAQMSAPSKTVSSSTTRKVLTCSNPVTTTSPTTQ